MENDFGKLIMCLPVRNEKYNPLNENIKNCNLNMNIIDGTHQWNSNKNLIILEFVICDS